MKKDTLIYFIAGYLLLPVTGCEQQKHKAEQRIIAEERLEEIARTSDLSDAVKATDLAGWDSVAAFKSFNDTAKMKLALYKAKLSDFKEKVYKGHKKVPILYRDRIQRFERRIAEMEQRVVVYKHGGKDGWEDFARLYRYDLLVLGQDIDKLVSKSKP